MTQQVIVPFELGQAMCPATIVTAGDQEFYPDPSSDDNGLSPVIKWLRGPVKCEWDTCHNGRIDTQRGDDTEDCEHCNGTGFPPEVEIISDHDHQGIKRYYNDTIHGVVRLGAPVPVTEPGPCSPPFTPCIEHRALTDEDWLWLTDDQQHAIDIQIGDRPVAIGDTFHHIEVVT